MIDSTALTAQEFALLHRRHGGFHDAEITSIEVSDDGSGLRLVLSDLRRFVGPDRLPVGSAKSIDFHFQGVILLQPIKREEFVEYGVNQFTITGTDTVSLKTVMGKASFTFATVLVSVID